jgi:hypothetical protein
MTADDEPGAALEVDERGKADGGRMPGGDFAYPSNVGHVAHVGKLVEIVGADRELNAEDRHAPSSG